MTAAPAPVCEPVRTNPTGMGDPGRAVAPVNPDFSGDHGGVFTAAAVMAAPSGPLRAGRMGDHGVARAPAEPVGMVETGMALVDAACVVMAAIREAVAAEAVADTGSRERAATVLSTDHKDGMQNLECDKDKCQTKFEITNGTIWHQRS